MKLLTNHRTLRSVLFFAALIVSLFYFSSNVEARVKTKKIIINSEAGAKIYVNGTLIGSTSTDIKIPAYTRSNVRVEKVGFITEERNYINDEEHEIPASVYIKLDKDDAFENSTITDIANQDVDLNTKLKEDDAWKVLIRVITSKFDIIQTSDKATGYIATAWSVKNFKSATVRTKLIIKPASSDPLAYKVKLVSEYGKPGASASQDEMFQPWERVLRTYDGIVSDLQGRLAK